MNIENSFSALIKQMINRNSITVSGKQNKKFDLIKKKKLVLLEKQRNDLLTAN